MTALGKLLRTTAFKLSLAFLVMFAIVAGLLLARVGSTVRSLIDEQTRQTIDAELNGLAEQYRQGGIRRLVQAVERRASRPGASLYLVTTFTGERVAGNVAQLPPGALDTPGAIEAEYSHVDEQVSAGHALARIFVLPGGFRLLVGRDLAERETLSKVLFETLLIALFWLTLIGAAGGLFVARRVLRRVDAMTASAYGIMAGDLAQRLPLAGSNDELDRLAINLNAMLERIGELMRGLKEVSDNIAHDLRTPLTRLRNGAEEALRLRTSPDEYRAALEKVIEESDGLIRIFNALLLIARAEAGTERETMNDFNLSAVARDVLRDQRKCILQVVQQRCRRFVVAPRERYPTAHVAIFGFAFFVVAQSFEALPRFVPTLETNRVRPVQGCARIGGRGDPTSAGTRRR